MGLTERLPSTLWTAALLIAGLAAGCTAPPPRKDESEILRPPVDDRTLDALIIDRNGDPTWLIDLRLRGAAPVFEPDDWTFFEVEVEGQEKPTIISFRDLRRVIIGEMTETWLIVELQPREGATVVGRIRRRAQLEGTTDFGPMTIPLRDVQQVSFGGAREATDTELEDREKRKRERRRR